MQRKMTPIARSSLLLDIVGEFWFQHLPDLCRGLVGDVNRGFDVERGFQVDVVAGGFRADFVFRLGLGVLWVRGGVETPHVGELTTEGLGETTWDFRRDGRGVFRVSLEYDDDLVCLGAVKSADRLMGYMLDGGERPDIGVETARIAALRGVPPYLPA